MSEDSNLDEVEAWLARNNVASSALGKHIAGDCALVSRWRKSFRKVTVEKRDSVLLFIRENPEGIPGYKKRKQKVHQRGKGAWSPDRVKPKEPEPPSNTSVPVPALSECSDAAWIKQTAFSKGLTIAQFLAELVELGIMVYRDTEAEELKEQERKYDVTS